MATRVRELIAAIRQVFETLFGCKRAAKRFVRTGFSYIDLKPVLRVFGQSICPAIGTYVNGRRLPLQGRGWGFESLRAYHLISGTDFSLWV